METRRRHRWYLQKGARECTSLPPRLPHLRLPKLIRTRLQVLELIPLYASIKPVDASNEFVLPESSSQADSNPTSSTDLEPFDFQSSLQILSSSQQTTLSTRFKRESDAYYLEAKRSMVASKAQIPVWIYGVLVVLGWNEFVAVIRSPVYFTFLLLAGAAAYVTWSLNMVSLLYFSFFDPLDSAI